MYSICHYVIPTEFQRPLVPNWFYSRIFHSRIFCSRIFHSRITGTLGFSTLGFFLRFCLRLYPVVFLDLLTFAVAAPEVLSLLADCMRTGLQANCSKISFSLDWNRFCYTVKLLNRPHINGIFIPFSEYQKVGWQHLSPLKIRECWVLSDFETDRNILFCLWTAYVSATTVRKMFLYFRRVVLGALSWQLLVSQKREWRIEIFETSIIIHLRQGETQAVALSRIWWALPRPRFILNQEIPKERGMKYIQAWFTESYWRKALSLPISNPRVLHHSRIYRGRCCHPAFQILESKVPSWFYPTDSLFLWELYM